MRASIYHHTMTMFARQGFHADPVKLQVSFGKDSTFWTNVFPTKLIERHQKEVKRLVTAIKVARWFEVFFALMPIKLFMKLWGFSKEFANTVALPMVALFLGTGNYAPEVPLIMLERLCTSPTYGMWYPMDKLSVVSNLPPMVVFPKFSDFYSTWKNDLVKKGVKVRLSTEVTQVVKRDKNGVIVKLIKRTPAKDGGHNPNSAWSAEGPDHTIDDALPPGGADADAQETTEHYDELVICTLADTANRILKKASTWRERKILGSTKFSDDITVTHSDANYMRKHYENFYNEEQAVTVLDGKDQTVRTEMAKKSFKPMYYIKMYEQDLTKLEMYVVLVLDSWLNITDFLLGVSTARTTRLNSHQISISTVMCSRLFSSTKSATATSGQSTRSTSLRSSAKTGGTNFATASRTTSSSFHGYG